MHSYIMVATMGARSPAATTIIRPVLFPCKTVDAKLLTLILGK
jgi:hypothetical protein